MKNISLYTIKLILSFLLSVGFFISCSEKDPELDIDTGPQGNATEVLVKLLIKGESILPLNTKQMDPDAEGSFQSDLQLLILKESGGSYAYECTRKVEGDLTSGFSVRVPSYLDGEKIKFLLFANAKRIIIDLDTQFMKDGSGIPESDILDKLVFEENQKWASTQKIPMWAEDSFTFNVPQDGTSTANLATLKLMRMLARVDVGVNYNGNEISSTAQGLSNFKLKEVKVYHTGSKGFLMPKSTNYTTTGAGADKKIEIISPSIPGGQKTDITAYSIPLASTDPSNPQYSCEREIYLFEQNIKKGSTGFDVSRSCILILGAYTPTGGQEKDGWYRLDFHNFGSNAGYSDVLRNMLYRFNIVKVTGPGYSSENDALQSVASNITVELIPMELEQNEVEFDGQHFLSVNSSELTFYANRKTQSIDLTTNHSKGWEIDLNGGDYITVSPESGKVTNGQPMKGKPEFTYTLDTPPTDQDPHIYIVAGNLKKKVSITYIPEDAPGNLDGFSLNPSVLYFLKKGGTGIVEILSNVTKKFLTKEEGEFSFTVPGETSSKNFNVEVSELAQNGDDAKRGVVNVQVKADNADVTSTCEIMQLTYPKVLDCTPNVMEHGVGSAGGKATLSVSYTTPEAAGNYMIGFASITGLGDSFSKPSDNATNSGTIEISAKPNKTSKKRPVGKLTFYPAISGEQISLVGYTPKEYTIEQDPVPAPTLSVSPATATSLTWNQANHTFTLNVDNQGFLENNSNEVLLSSTGAMKVEVPSTATVGQAVNLTVSPNRTDGEVTKTITARVRGWDGQVSTLPIELTQEAPAEPTKPEFKNESTITLNWDKDSVNLSVSDLNNIYEVRVMGDNPINGKDKLAAKFDPQFTIDPQSKTGVLTLKFSKNESDRVRGIKLDVRAYGNRESSFYSGTYRVEQGAKPASVGSIVADPVDLYFGFEAESKSLGFVTEGVSLLALDLLSKPDWVQISNPTNDNRNYTITVPENLSNADRNWTLNVSCTDAGNVLRTTTVLISQLHFPLGAITPNPRALNFTRLAGEQILQIETFQIQKGTLKVELLDRPGWIALQDLYGDNSRVKVKVVRNTEAVQRTATLRASGVDLRGRRVEENVTITQAPSEILVTDKQFVLPHEGNVTKESFYTIDTEANSLPFDNVTITTAEGDYRETFSSIRVEKVSSTSYRIFVPPTLRDKTYSDTTVPITVKLSRNDGVEASCILSFTRKGMRARMDTDLDDYSWPSNGAQIFKKTYAIATSGLRPGGRVLAMPPNTNSRVLVNMNGATHDGYTIGANATYNSLQLYIDGRGDSIKGRYTIIGSGVDGKDVVLGYFWID